MLGAVPQQRRGGHHDVGTGKQVLGHVVRGLDPGSRRERGAHPSVQERDPRARQPCLRRVGEADLAHHGERVGVDVGLQESVEQHQGVRARFVEPQRHLAGRAEVRAQLDGHRDADRVLHPGQDVDVPLLDIAARDARVAGEVVDVQLDRGCAGLLHRAGIVGPATRRDTVEAADHRDLDDKGRALEQAQILARAGLVFGSGGEVGERLREALGAGVDQPRVLGRLPVQLFLEEGVEDNRADAGMGTG